MPEVSVIIPCYNHARYLPFAVKSVLAQTFPDWEAIIVDDGSTDDTAAVAASFTDPRIVYVSQGNRGLSSARNSGIRHARGGYLAFLDADDEWEAGFLARCVSVLERDVALGFVYTRNYFIDPDGARQPQIGGQALTPAKFSQRIWEEGFFPPHSVLLRRQVLTTVGNFDPNLTSAEDWDLWLRISQHYPVSGIEEPLARYRVYTGSMSTNAARMHANRIAVLTKHFGAPEGEPAAWSDEKRRAYAFAYRTTALGYLQQQEPDTAWLWLRAAAQVWPRILGHLDTFYEVALGDQPRGHRGDAKSLDIAANGAEMLRRLDVLLTVASPHVQAVRPTAFGNAYLALGMLSDQAGDWAAARSYLRRAFQAHPVLLREPLVVRRFAKLLLGQRAARGVCRLWLNIAGDAPGQ